MSSAAELFVVTLAKASRRARRHLRGLERADREDVLATAILWCWENRTTYNPAVALEDWFVSAIRDARKKWALGEAREATELTEAIAVPDDTSIVAEILDVWEKVERFVGTLSPVEQKIASLQAHGHSTDEIVGQLSVSDHTVTLVRRKLAPFKKLMPETRDWNRVIRKAQSTDSDQSSDELSPIDKEIEKLDFPPPAGKECPPCWRCKWFEGYLPGAHKSLRMPLVEPDVRAAVLEVEARKVEIATLVRAGLFKR